MSETALERVRGIVLDVDGVLTDGTVYLGAEGMELKRFSILDGVGLVWCRLLGYRIAIVSGRHSEATDRRARELGIEAVYQGVRDKAWQVAAWAAEQGLALDEVLYMGDDHIDLPVFAEVGVSVAPANADAIVRASASFVTERAGGAGAVREAVEWMLTNVGRLDEALEAYRSMLLAEPE
jgi:3-deoxy-D-manno-octulosonate 8-phosphate phosphatase (KDO 8-P phosphatase)